MPAEIDDVRFPDKILRGATGGPSYSTTVGTTDSGFEQRNQNWAESRRKFSVARRVTNEDQMTELLAFFHARRGRARGFLFRDPTDFHVGLVWHQGSGYQHDDPQQFALGDGAETAFQLTKVYASGGQTVTRNIHRPLDDQRSDVGDTAVPVKVYFDGVEQATGWTVDYATGVVTFDDPPDVDVSIEWAGMFDIAARFDTDEPKFDVDAMWAATWSGIDVCELREAVA